LEALQEVVVAVGNGTSSSDTAQNIVNYLWPGRSMQGAQPRVVGGSGSLEVVQNLLSYLIQIIDD